MTIPSRDGSSVVFLHFNEDRVENLGDWQLRTNWPLRRLDDVELENSPVSLRTVSAKEIKNDKIAIKWPLKKITAILDDKDHKPTGQRLFATFWQSMRLQGGQIHELYALG